MKKLSLAQREILSMFDGMKWVNGVELDGTYSASLKVLRALGFITFQRQSVRQFPETPGGMVWHQYQNSRRVIFRVSATQAGKDFIYNGGLDQ